MAMDFQIEQLKQLPRRPDVAWVGGLLRLPLWLEGNQGPYRPALPVWLVADGGPVSSLPEPPDESLLNPAVLHQSSLDALVGMALDPERGGYLPGRLEANDPDLTAFLQHRLAELHLEIVYEPDDESVDAMVECMLEADTGPARTAPLLSVNGMTVERVRAFAEAAEAFFRAKPFRLLGTEDPIEIEAPTSPAKELSVALVMRESEPGLAFHASMASYWRTMESPDVESAVPPSGMWTLYLTDITDLPFRDGQLWQEHQLPVAGPDAYPLPAHIRPGAPKITRPSPETLTFMEGLLRALARTQEAQVDTGQWSVPVETFDGPAEYRLRLPLLLDPPPLERVQAFRPPMTDDLYYLQDHLHRFKEQHEFAEEEPSPETVAKEFLPNPGEQPYVEPRNDRERARDLAYEAHQAMGRRQILLARQALEVDPDCVSAHALLGDQSSTAEQARAHYERALQAGRRVMGPEDLQAGGGPFNRHPESGYYIEVLVAQAKVQLILGEREAPLEHLREAIRLEPSDFNEARDLLLPALLEQDDYEGADDLLADFPDDDRPIMAWARALVRFRLEGDSSDARFTLSQAFQANPEVADYLLGQDDIDLFEPLDATEEEIEAHHAAASVDDAWQATPGAMEWLEKYMRRRERAARRHRPAKGKGRKKRR